MNFIGDEGGKNRVKILITGATGSVGKGAAEHLALKHDVRLSDIKELNTVNTALPYYQADVRTAGALDSVSEGVDVIIHTPAWHGIHGGSRSEKEFYDLNVTGTFEMFQSAVRKKVRRVVWLSSLSVYGNDFYAYTKKLGEQLCRFYHDRHRLEVIMLRPADFTPFKDLRHYGERLLHGGVDRRDVLQAVCSAVVCQQSYGAYNTLREDSFTEEDVRAYLESPVEVLDKVYPGARTIIKNYRLVLPKTISVSDLSNEKKELGYEPKFNFGTFIQECTKDGIIID